MKLAFFLLALSGIALAQGPLTPPGAPGATMKTLDQIEPAIPVAAGAAVATLSQPGSYYLTGNRTAGITISSSNVTLDLRGHQIAPGAVGDAIQVNGTAGAPLARIAIRNGTIQGGSTGILLLFASQSTVEDLRIAGARSGIFCSANGGVLYGLQIRRCSISGAAGQAIIANGVGAETSGCIIEDCTIADGQILAGGDTGDGIIWGGFGSPSRGNVIRNCTITHCDGVGINIPASAGIVAGNRITGCTVTDCGGNGISLSSSAAGKVRGNRVDGCQVDACASGILISGNGGGSGNVITDNVVTGCTGTGIATFGSTGGLTHSNHSAGNTVANYSLVATDTNGPIVTTAGTLTATGNDAHPRANFSR